MILYHASPIQGLKVLDPDKTLNSNLRNLKKYVYASDDISFAAGFCFQWNTKEGFKFWNFSDQWILTIPKKFLSRLKIKCSLYMVDPIKFQKLKGVETPEYYSIGNVKVLEEIKYRSALDCLKLNKVEIKLI